MRSTRFRTPRALAAGGTIGVFSPAGSPDAARVARGVTALESHGYRVVVSPNALGKHEYFSGTDEERLKDFHDMLADPGIDMMMMSRGGYGLSRIVHLINWSAVAKSEKILCGFSDFTAINLAALAQANIVTLAGPGVATDFGDDTSAVAADVADHHAFMEAHFWPVVAGETDTITVACEHRYAPQSLTGPIWGSNLSLLCDLGGSRFIPDMAGGILFIEEIGEKPYTIERMFWQLYHSGVLSSQRAIVLGDFADSAPAADRYPYDVAHVVKTLRNLLSVPVLTSLPFGHVPRKLTIPYGADAVLQIRDGEYALSY